MLINLRNALMAGKRLPYDAEVEYLESTGTQWIDASFSGYTNGAEMDIVFSIDGTGDYVNGFGNNQGRGPASASSWFYVRASSGNTLPFCVNYDAVGGSAYVSKGVTHHLVARYGNGFLDGVTYTQSGASTRTHQDPFIIFPQSSSPVVVKLWSLKLSNNGILLRDLIPVRKGTIGYLYDRVSGKLFGNAGTGDFVLGPDVVPVEYIESHGTEWIDTGVVPDSATKWDIDAQFQSNAYGQIMGRTGGSGSNPRFAFGLDIQTSGHGLTWYCGLGDLNTWNGTFDRSRHTFSLDAPNKTFAVDNTAFSVSYAVIDGTRTIRLFARIVNTSMQNFCNARVFGSQIYNSSVQVRSFRPIRVGSGSTWEGAMMDVLTRRIYRNAGTGAFTYGNDLKYPIPSE